ncbi:hypothetical protein L0P88_06535 [Muricauda sp. SCSIO 64092]|uniref:hypothetical protein n=1 Tax=Allomuricauda sp. SCSIO 64092 TaxID=2908842 RepID=UPI001FF0F95D|nr:hypothetical protein [Muricauda sp. SCSIO 64092]UOY08206.1 hypothetical protein L0P88_06535 [Muricauda sp. SCSIO 64092]
MKYFKYHVVMAGLLLSTFTLSAQDTNDQDDASQGSNIQNLTPSKLIGKGQWDIKWFNNLYTETEDTFSGDIPRNVFFTSTLDIFTGVGQNRRVNVGLLLEFRSNTVGGRGLFDFLSFDGEEGSARSGLTSFAPAIKFTPFASVNNFSIQSAFFIPLVDNETENGVFLDQDGFIWQNRFFYDYSFAEGKWQLFSEINSELNFGDEADSFANNSLRLTPGLFLSYFPSSKFTVLVLAQHSQLLDLGGTEFSQDFTALGGGLKYQITKELNIEGLYTNFVRGNDTGLGETFNIGLRAVF